MGYKPTFEEFKESAKQGNLIPVYKEILADLDTPVSAYMKIGGEPYSFLLESVEGGDKWARYCFLGCGPSIIIETKGSTVTVRNNGVEQKKNVEGAIPLSVLKEILSQYQPVDMPGLPRFSGGAVGFISYDMVRYFENLPDQTEDDLDIPDSIFVITDTLLIFDNVNQTIKVVSNAHTEGRGLEEVYKETLAKIDALEKKLRQPAPQTSVGTPGASVAGDPRIESNFAKEHFKEAVLKANSFSSCSKSFSKFWSSSSFWPRLRVPAMGRTSTSSPSRRTKTSGDEPTT